VPFVTISVPAVKIPYLDKFITTQQPVTAAPTEQTAPLIVGEAIAQQNTPNVINTKPAQQPVVQTPAPDYLPYILIGIYGMAVVALLIRFAKNSLHISHLVTKNTIVNYQDTKLVLIDEEVTPHSFLNYVFINKDAYQSGGVEPQIICHEQAHVRQLHSLDVIFVELLQVVFWFNPFIPFYRKAIQLNHEFLADEAVIESYRDTSAYQYLLLAKASQCGSLYLTSQFNYLITKKRLIMMTKNTSAKIAFYKKLAMVPLLATAIFLFSQKSTAAIVKDVKTKDSRKTAIASVKLSENDKPYLHIVKPTEWKNIMGVELNSRNNSKDIGIFIKNLKDVDIFIKKLNKSYNSNYRLITMPEFEFFVHKHPSIIKLKGMLLIVRGNINYNEINENVVMDTLTSAEKTAIKKFSASFKFRGTKHADIDAPAQVINTYHAILKRNGVTTADKGITPISSADTAQLHQLYEQMSVEQQDMQILRFLGQGKPMKRSIVSSQQLTEWQTDAKKYGVWIDGKRIKNESLANYKASDFDLYFFSRLYANARKNDGFSFQANLYTKAWYANHVKEILEANKKPRMMQIKIVNGKARGYGAFGG
jgi:hypothetical protein